MKIILLTALAAALAHSAVAAEITVSAAASLTDAFNDIAKAYQTHVRRFLFVHKTGFICAYSASPSVI